MLDNIHNRNDGSNFGNRMRQLFSYSYLERMRGLYDFGPDDVYSNDFSKCARKTIEQNQISSDITNAIDIMEYQFRSLYHMREILFSIHIVFSDLERGVPFEGCLLSFTQLFYCQICMPETATLLPCRNVCKNILSGCTIFLHVTGEELTNSLQALCQLNTMTTNASWNLQTALSLINNKLYSIFDTPKEELLLIESAVSLLVYYYRHL